MVFVKVVKNKAYFKRYQVKYRRRREGKTDYHARRQMVLQDKTKFGSPKYRLVVRITNKDIIAQIIHAKIVGDEVIMAAYSHELPAFGISLGLTNYAAAYATGLLLARRLLSKLRLADQFNGVPNADGKYTPVRTKKTDDGESEDRFPFKAILDIGLARTTTGSRVFGVMKGAVDGGLAIPHRENRFPGFNKESGKLNDSVHRDRIFGKHVGEYLKQVIEDNAMSSDQQGTQFSQYIATKVNPDAMEAMYKKAHEAIRANPMNSVAKKTASTAPKGERKSFQTQPLTRAQRLANIERKVTTLRQRLMA